MRTFLTWAVLACASSGAIGAGADYYLKIDGVAAHGEHTYLKVNAGDLDGDGAADEAVVRLKCTVGGVATAHYSVKSPRDLATGQSSGKRTHQPVTFIKEWGPSTPQLRAMSVGYDLKQAKGARTVDDGWQMMSLINADGLCPAAQAAVKASKSRSNIQNN